METVLVVPTAEAMYGLGERLGGLLRAGDLVVLDGALGAGKTTLTRGIGAGLGVRGPISSPTFVIARVHPSLVDGPELVHVDAYRLDALTDIDELDLDISMDSSVTVVEWGAGRVEDLATSVLTIEIRRSVGFGASAHGTDEADEVREVALHGRGEGWPRRLADLAP